MNAEKEKQIRELSKVYVEKRMRFDAMGMANTCGKTPEELIQQAADAHVAEAEMMEAYAALKARQSA